MHNRNSQCLAIELYKVFNGICPDIIKDVSPLSTSSGNLSQTVLCLGHLVWELIPNNIKSLGNLPKFKKVIKNWKPDVCPCRQFKKVIKNGNLRFARVGSVDSTFLKSTLCGECSFNFHFYIH